MPVTLAMPLRDHKRPPPLPMSSPTLAAAAPPPLPSMRVPKGTVPHGQVELASELSLHEAVLEARRESEELEWQAQVAQAKDTLLQSEQDEWQALRARNASVRIETPPRRVQRPAKRALALAPVARLLTDCTADNQAELAAEEREWQALRARARELEEREWEALIARARAATAQPRQRALRPRATVVAWP